MNEKQLIDKIQSILELYIHNDEIFTKEQADKLAEDLFQLEPIEKTQPKRTNHQTIRIQREARVWVPITVYFEINELGILDLLRIHSKHFIQDYHR